MSYTIQGKTTNWELVIGLEVHCQIISNSKVFSGASATFGAEQNTHVSSKISFFCPSSTSFLRRWFSADLVIGGSHRSES